jgi:hypothetical protein
MRYDARAMRTRTSAAVWTAVIGAVGAAACGHHREAAAHDPGAAVPVHWRQLGLPADREHAVVEASTSETALHVRYAGAEADQVRDAYVDALLRHADGYVPRPAADPKTERLFVKAGAKLRVRTLADQGGVEVTVDETPAPPGVTDTIEPVGVLDLERVVRPHQWIIRNADYEITFPLDPTITAVTTTTPDGKQLAGAQIVEEDAGDLVEMTMLPAPAGSTFDAKTALDAMGKTLVSQLAAAGIEASIASQSPAVLGNLQGRAFVMLAVENGRPKDVEAYAAFDPVHRVAISFLVEIPKPAGSPLAGVLESFKPRTAVAATARR